MKEINKKGLFFFLIATVIIFIIIVLVKNSNSNIINNIIILLNERYGEEFFLDKYNGHEYENSVIFSFKRTGKGTLNVHRKGCEDTKFEVYFQYNLTELISDYYLESTICYNTSRRIEQDYKIGNNMYVFTKYNRAMSFSNGESRTATLFDVDYPLFPATILIYVEGVDNWTEQEIYDYQYNIPSKLKSHISEYTTISLIKLKPNSIEKIKKCYENDDTNSLKYNLMYEEMDVKEIDI